MQYCYNFLTVYIICCIIHCPKYLATFRDIEGNVTAKKLYTRETFEIGIPIYALKLQLTDHGTFRDPPHAAPLHSLCISRNISWYTTCSPPPLARCVYAVQARTLTTRLLYLDKKNPKKVLFQIRIPTPHRTVEIKMIRCTRLEHGPDNL